MIYFQINFASFCIYLYSKCTQEKTYKPAIQRTTQVLCFSPGFSFFYACVNSWMHSTPMTVCPGSCFCFSTQISHYRVEKSLRKSRGQTRKTLSAHERRSFLSRSDGETVKILIRGWQAGLISTEMVILLLRGGWIDTGWSGRGDKGHNPIKMPVPRVGQAQAAEENRTALRCNQ